MSVIGPIGRIRQRLGAAVPAATPAEGATLARIEVELAATVAFRALLSRRAEGHRACGDVALADLLTTEVATLTTFIVRLDAERFTRGGGID